MKKLIALFSYDFPHRKTQDFIFDLVASGMKEFVVIAAPKKVLKHNDGNSYFPISLQLSPPFSTEELCRNLGLPFFRIEHEDVAAINCLRDRYGFDFAIISGARIIPESVIDLFDNGIINFHPGKIPETSGLDALYFSIEKAASIGVTTHYIDNRVDAGRLVHFDELIIGPIDTPEIVMENIYHLQRTALKRLITDFLSGSIVSTPIHRPLKNEPMMADAKRDAIVKFCAWRAYRYTTQQRSLLFGACERGDINQACQILDQVPDFLTSVDENGWTPLIVASFNQRSELVNMLLLSGANPNSTGRNGTTPLMYAKTKLINLSNADYSILDVLIKHGADCLRKDRFGKSVIDYVRATDDKRMIDYFDTCCTITH